MFRDTTQSGHSLGPPEDRMENAVPERDLSPLSVTIQRLLVHASMLLAAVTGQEQVCLLLLWLY